MKNKILVSLVCLLPFAANAAVPYRVEQVGTIPAEPEPGATNDSESFAREHRFYIGAGYNFSMWNDAQDDAVRVSGGNASSFDGAIGVRVYDTFRLEANYVRLDAKWDSFGMTGNAGFVNAIFDARIDSIYRMFRKQLLVPYIGFGAGLSWNSVTDVAIKNKITPAAAALAGVAVEMGGHFALDFGYKYIYVFTPDFDAIKDLAPTAHQFRAGVRVNF
jgi:opacity protein-like surface antigen